ncbi:hypothetical protein GO011_07010 [Mycobacterium sp. 20091114027_K0903767]|nr:hypothetical protein [Mycobacterium sp. 20091114027_K0903767]
MTEPVVFGAAVAVAVESPYDADCPLLGRLAQELLATINANPAPHALEDAGRRLAHAALDWSVTFTPEDHERLCLGMKAFEMLANLAH